MKQTLTLHFSIGDRVYFIDDAEINGRIIEIAIQGGGRIVYRVCWMHNGKLEMEYFDEFLIDLCA